MPVDMSDARPLASGQEQRLSADTVRLILFISLSIASFFGLAQLVVALVPAFSSTPGWTFEWLSPVLTACAAIAVIVRVIVYRAHRVAWSLLSMALVLMTISTLLPPATSDAVSPLSTTIAIAVFGCFVVTALLAVIMLSRSSSTQRRITALLDSVVAAFGAVMIASLFLLDASPMGLGAAPDADNGVTALLALAGPAIVTAVLVGAATSFGRRPTITWWLLFAGFATVTAASAFVASDTSPSSTAAIAIGQALWPTAALLMAWAAWSRSAPPPRGPRSELALALAPVVFVIASVTVIVLDEILSISQVTVFLALATLACGVLRLIWAVTDSTRLHRHDAALNAQLARARDDALDTASAKANFLSTMSHEIRTPMTAIVGMTELLLDTPMSSAQRELLEVVRRGGDQLIDLVTRVLDFSKLEEGTVELENRDFDIVDCVDDAASLINRSAEAKGLRLYVDRRGVTVRRVTGDEARVRQVLINLVSNAVKFTAQGRVAIVVTTHSGVDPRSEGLLRIDVVDTGIGIRTEDLHRLFESFRQLSSSTNRLYGGTGLGLSISRSLATLMGGRIDVVSTPESGSMFSLVLPLMAASAVPDPAVESFDVRGVHVLMVDREGDIAAIRSAELTAAGAVCTPAQSLGEATTIITHRPDVIVVDHEFAGDADVVAALRALNADRRVPVVGIVPISHLARISGDGTYDGVIARPVLDGALVRAVAQALSPTALSPDETDAPPTPGSAPHDTQTVLIVDDNPTNLRTARHTLTKAGHTVETRESGKGAISAIHRGAFDVVLMDINMPVMDGFEATRAIRALGETITQPRIIALSANVSEDDRRKGMESGMDGVLAKPIKAGDLVAAITSADGAATEPVKVALEAAQLDVLLDMDPELQEALVAEFRSGSAADIGALTNGVSDLELVARHAHRIAGSAASIGADALMVLGRGIETRARQGRTPTNSELAQLQSALTQALAALERALRNPGAGSAR